ncbi:hypothetical protein C882_3414 [Caenispirillum salinarum AK4]|uniref:Uncharacterized protein n=1 Tax=Caenispirillum salinarum AK4 TaxID=1238182 RepID=K9H3S0_9PROT|nr:hypothetical protein C882_3414 [Caenispirillum salinarum AK4]
MRRGTKEAVRNVSFQPTERRGCSRQYEAARLTRRKDSVAQGGGAFYRRLIPLPQPRQANQYARSSGRRRSPYG